MNICWPRLSVGRKKLRIRGKCVCVGGASGNFPANVDTLRDGCWERREREGERERGFHGSNSRFRSSQNCMSFHTYTHAPTCTHTHVNTHRLRAGSRRGQMFFFVKILTGV